MPGNEPELNAEQLLQWDRQHLWHHLAPHKNFASQEPLILVEGKGCVVRDIRGREYLDALSGGVWCVNAGYGQDTIAEAVYRQLKRLPYYALTGGNVPAILLAKKLAELLPGLPRVFLSNSGTEANEAAFKICRQYFRLKYPSKEKLTIIYRYRDYPGTTIAALSATGQAERKTGYEPMLPGFLPIPPAYCYRCFFQKTYPGCDIDCARALEKVVQFEGEDSVAAVIVEPVTAGGGILVPVAEYFSVLREICRKYEVLLIADEVVTGFGRTGRMFGHEHWGADPDLVTMAKGIASAYMPLSATSVREEIFKEFLRDPEENRLGYFRHISTYGGNAAICAAALENIRIIEERGLCANSEKMGRHLLNLLKELEDLPPVGEVRGLGLLAGIELVADKKTKAPADEQTVGRVVAKAAEQGVLIGKMNRAVPGHNNVLTIAPPLIVEKEQIEQIVRAVRNALENAE